MKLAIDFSHLLILRDLDTGAETYYMLPRGQTTPIHVPGMTIEDLKQLMHPKLEEPDLPDSRDEGGQGTVVSVEREPEPEAVSQAASVLMPGTLGDDSDPFGVAEG